MTTQSAVRWTVDRVKALGRREIIDLWEKCPAVEMSELYGEYQGLVPNADDEQAEKLTAAVMFKEDGPLGYWLGKAYIPLSRTRGDGYNIWRRPGGKVERYMRFGTEMGTSLIDGKPSLLMCYGAYRHRFVPEGTDNTLVDEIRKLADGIYLGVGTTAMPDGTRSRPGHFVLVGPSGKYLAPDDALEELI